MQGCVSAEPIEQVPMTAQSQMRDRASMQASCLARPVFLVGTFRSGTTLLAELLGRSDDIAHCRFELKDLWSSVGRIAMASPKTGDRTCPECSTDEPAPAAAAALSRAFRERMAGCVGKGPDAVLLNKNPHLCNKLPLVKSWFPDARFIWIHRGLPQVAASIKRLFVDIRTRQSTWHYWPPADAGTRNRCWGAAFSAKEAAGLPAERVFPGGNVLYLAEYWLEANRAVSEFFRHLPADNRLVVREEELLADPQRELGRAFEFLQARKAFDSDLMGSIEPARNANWRMDFSGVELEVLHTFVSARRVEINAIFPHVPPVASDGVPMKPTGLHVGGE